MTAVNLAVMPRILPVDRDGGRAARSAVIPSVTCRRARIALFSMNSVLFSDSSEHELVPRCCMNRTKKVISTLRQRASGDLRSQLFPKLALRTVSEEAS